MFKFETSALKGLSPISASRQSLRPPRWRSFGYWLVLMSFFMLIIAAWLRPDFNRPPLADWKPFLARGDHAAEAGDLQQARYLYLQVERIASWNRDWQGTIAAACWFNKLDGAPALACMKKFEMIATASHDTLNMFAASITSPAESLLLFQ